MGKQLFLRMFLAVLIGTLLIGCQSSRSIQIGLAVELTGPRSELGVAVRNGAQLAVEAANSAGGVAGRELELVVRDDQGKPEIARQVDQELIDAGVSAIIGHITSEQTAAALEMINQAQVVLVSPTSSSSMFTGKDDYFFRVMPSNEWMGEMLAQHALYNGINQVLGIYDLNNRAFSETYWHAFQEEFTRIGGESSQEVSFRSGESNLQEVMFQVKAVNPQAVLIIASAVDTALLVQYARQQELGAKLYSSTWAQTTELLEKGGQAVDGLELSATFHPDYPSPEYQQFLLAYQGRYGSPPILGASHAYECVLLLAYALEKTQGKPEGLADALKGVNGLNGLQGKITMDPFGDVERDVFFVRVQNGEFVIAKSITMP